jgi:hypothetical protein
MVENLSHMATGSQTHGSESASNTVTYPAPSYQPPGSPSESVIPADIRPQVDPVPPVSAANVAGPGDRGGTLHGQGDDPGSGHMWTMASDIPSGGDSPWTTARQPVSPDAGH